MPCRRSDRNSLIGCNIGEYSMFICRPFCCVNWNTCNPKLPEHERPHLLTQDYDSSHFRGQDPPHGRNRTGLRFSTCKSPYRPKFICPRKSCRRSIKPFFDSQRVEYEEWSNGALLVRPLPERCPEFAEALRVDQWIDKARTEASLEKWKRRNELFQRYAESKDTSSAVDPLSPEEFTELKSMDPDVWWTELVSGDGLLEEGEVGYRKRCPSCEDAVVRVGSNFRIPAKKDEKGWREVEAMIEQGVDMVAKFEFCPTVEQWDRMRRKADRIRKGEEPKEEPKEKRWRRIASLDD